MSCYLIKKLPQFKATNVEANTRPLLFLSLAIFPGVQTTRVYTRFLGALFFYQTSCVLVRPSYDLATQNPAATFHSVYDPVISLSSLFLLPLFSSTLTCLFSFCVLIPSVILTACYTLCAIAGYMKNLQLREFRERRVVSLRFNTKHARI